MASDVETKFDGYGFDELLEPLGLSLPADDDTTADIISSHLSDMAVRLIFTSDDAQALQTVSIVRAFLTAMASWDTYERPVWQGLLAVEHPHTFLSLAACLVPKMWN